MNFRIFDAKRFGSIKLGVLFLAYFIPVCLLANDIPENKEVMSANFEEISLGSLFQILAYHNHVNIEMDSKAVGLDAKLVSVRFKGLRPDIVYGALLDCFGLSSELINRSYVVESVAAPNFSSQACLDNQLR